ncbi:MAG: DUF2797 domain-containing protein [Gammaproteobacteria bacterium]|nr:DUF2797 domain-containing protein [Gammaproteobacteria bacterium]MDH5654016.1 DUF2797 domain-containing protein [Gammaproteobacteria bacterium]
MSTTGNLLKMHTSLAVPVEYQLPVGDTLLPLNDLIGNKLTLEYTGEINCIHCGRKSNKSFSQGYCFPCFKSLAQCDMCIVKPETCHFHAGTCREPDWAQDHCMQPHFVYLANSSGIKVGITRGSQIPTRWIDQGASSAMPIFKAKDRLTSGKLEMALKQHVADKTDWRKMLKGEPDSMDLAARRDEIVNATTKELKQLEKELGCDAFEFLPAERQQAIVYPVQHYPLKVTAHNLDKTPKVSGVLQGIKGQYLIFDNGVMNIRKYGGYKVKVTV